MRRSAKQKYRAGSATDPARTRAEYTRERTGS
jgi:hypothetical protein